MHYAFHKCKWMKWQSLFSDENTPNKKINKTRAEHQPVALPSSCCPRLSKFFKPSSMIGFRLDRSKVGHSSWSLRAISKHSNLGSWWSEENWRVWEWTMAIYSWFKQQFTYKKLWFFYSKLLVLQDGNNQKTSADPGNNGVGWTESHLAWTPNASSNASKASCSLPSWGHSAEPNPRRNIL